MLKMFVHTYVYSLYVCIHFPWYLVILIDLVTPVAEQRQQMI